MFITLHHPSALDDNDVVSKVYQQSAEFLTALAIPHNSWPGHFTSNTKMVHYLESLNGLNDPNKFIFHSDLDEIVDPTSLRQAMGEMNRGECDAIVGVWQDRVTLQGDLKRVELNDGQIEEQYPLRCSYSKHFMPERTTRKVVVYRSNLRLTSGQHEVWCNIGPDGATEWNREEACNNHIDARADKSTKSNYILHLLPQFDKKPRMCSTVVVVDHYKFIAGVQQHLADRMVNYKNLGLVWWKQSMEILEDIKRHENKLCTLKCPKFNCYLKDLPREHEVIRKSDVLSGSGQISTSTISGKFPNSAIPSVGALHGGSVDPMASKSALGMSAETAAIVESAVGFKVFSEVTQSKTQATEAVGRQSQMPLTTKNAVQRPTTAVDTVQDQQQLQMQPIPQQIPAAQIPLVAKVDDAENDVVDPALGTAPIEPVAVTTLFNPRKNQAAKSTAGPIAAMAHPNHPTIGSRRDIENISRLDRIPRLLLFGEATLSRVTEEKELWQSFQKQYTAVNFAVGGERTDTMLYRVRYSDWHLLSTGKEGMRDESSNPLIALIMIGTNDVGNGDSAEKIALSIDAIINEMIAKIPHLTHIFVLSILPRAMDSFNVVIDDVNRRISELYAQTKLLNGAITAIDLTPLFKTKDGSMKLNMYTADRFHPSTLGYQSIIRALQPLFGEIIVAHGSSKPAQVSVSNLSLRGGESSASSSALFAELAADGN